MKVLIVEDDADAAAVATTCLKVRWTEAEIDVASTNYEARLLLSNSEYEIVLVDLNLPDGQSTDLLDPAIMTGNPAILVITASDDDVSLFRSLEAGADDYISKPYSPIELQARVNAAIRKRNHYLSLRADEGEQDIVRLGREVALDRRMKSLSIAGENVPLTPMEYSFLIKLTSHSGRIVSMNELSTEVWDSSDTDFGAIKAVVKRLRAKLDHKEIGSQLIKTHRGFGYSITVIDDRAAAA